MTRSILFPIVMVLVFSLVLFLFWQWRARFRRIRIFTKRELIASDLLFAAALVPVAMPFLFYFFSGRFHPIPVFSAWYSFFYVAFLFGIFSLFFYGLLRGVMGVVRRLRGTRTYVYRFRNSAEMASLLLFLFLYVNFLITQGQDAEISEHTVSIPQFETSWSGFRILHISDLHIGPVVHRDYLHRIARQINEVNADMLVVTGDIIDHDMRYAPLVQKFFSELKKFPLGTYAIMGNHDMIESPEPLQKALAQSGVTVLLNQMRSIEYKGSSFFLVGLDYPSLREHMLGSRSEVTQNYFRRATVGLSKKDKKVVLNHHPTDFYFLQSQDVQLVLSGHTHGGQLEFSRRHNSLSLVGLFHPFYKGWYRGKSGESLLYVNSGLGHWFPVRINCPAEITVIEWK